MKILVSLFFAIVLKSTIGNITVVQRCPETKTAWDHRASMVTCENKDMKYHCIMSSTWTLLEVCLIPLNISENEDGCPAVIIFKSTAFWMFPFTPCSTQNTKCPQKGNGGYSSEQLFKYPACFLNLSERVSGDKEFQQTTIETVTNRISKYSEHWEEFYRADTVYLAFLSICTLVVLGILSVLYFLQNRLIKQLIKEVKEERKIRYAAPLSNASSVKEERKIRYAAPLSNASSDTDLDLMENKSFLKTFRESRSTKARKNMLKEYDGYSGDSDDDKGQDNAPQPVPDLRNRSVKTLPCTDDEFSNYYFITGDEKGHDHWTQSVPESRNVFIKTFHCKEDVPSHNYISGDVKGNEHTPLSLPELRNNTRRRSPVMDEKH